MYSRNSRGPSIEPWGTPQRMRLVSDFTLGIYQTTVDVKIPIFCDIAESYKSRVHGSKARLIFRK